MTMATQPTVFVFGRGRIRFHFDESMSARVWRTLRQDVCVPCTRAQLDRALEHARASGVLELESELYAPGRVLPHMHILRNMVDRMSDTKCARVFAAAAIINNSLGDDPVPLSRVAVCDLAVNRFVQKAVVRCLCNVTTL